MNISTRARAQTGDTRAARAIDVTARHLGAGLAVIMDVVYNHFGPDGNFLPSYSPELNPEERLNADLKHAIYSKVPVRNKDKLKAATTEHMQILEKSPERVKKYFQDARVKYAA